MRKTLWEQGTNILLQEPACIACTTPRGQPRSMAITSLASAAWRSAVSALHWPKSSSTSFPSSCTGLNRDHARVLSDHAACMRNMYPRRSRTLSWIAGTAAWLSLPGDVAAIGMCMGQSALDVSGSTFRGFSLAAGGCRRVGLPAHDTLPT